MRKFAAVLQVFLDFAKRQHEKDDDGDTKKSLERQLSGETPTLHVHL